MMVVALVLARGMSGIIEASITASPSTSVPTVNSMLVMGIVSLPGMMTGQILAGAAPGDAVRYQIMIVFMIAATVSTATFGVTMLAYGRIFTSDHRLRSAGALGIQLD